jgi:hypothetical protein
MNDAHRLVGSSHPGGLLFECAEECGRRLIVDRTSGELTILDRGDLMALHRGSMGGVDLAMPDVTQPERRG